MWLKRIVRDWAQRDLERTIRALPLWTEVDWQSSDVKDTSGSRCVLGQPRQTPRAGGLPVDHTPNSYGSKAFLKGLWSAQHCIPQSALFGESQVFSPLPRNNSQNLQIQRLQFRESISHGHNLLLMPLCPPFLHFPLPLPHFPLLPEPGNMKSADLKGLPEKLRSSWEKKIKKKYKTVQNRL